MTSRYLVLALAITFSANVIAGEDILGALATETGLTKRQVKMVVGPRSAHGAYPASYDQVQRQFVREIGRERYTDLLVGREIRLFHPDQRVASVTLPAPLR